MAAAVAAALPLPPTPPATECILCASPIPASHRTPPARAPTLPCGHTHCLACLRRNFHIALVSAPFQPARCCDPAARIEPALLRDCLGLTSHEAHAYRERLAEHDTRDKVYCFDPRCSAFIPAMLRAGRMGRCRVCWKKTCLRCGGRGHFGGCGVADLDADGDGDGDGVGVDRGDGTVAVGGRGFREVAEGNRDGAGAVAGKGTGMGTGMGAKGKKKPRVSNDERFWRLSREMGWKRCPDCKRWVEKTDGCNHIACICGCHFCYRCGRAPYGNHGECAM
ncbi:hypothetical protein MFIFM68171_01548 [Madurella fahalii]|uniref:RBR-type E3 ubiquitin transferase n=1 Tax=Madurella fahalii TaxID=1157608 RepID=A0ABQ0G0Q5_9PEZI